MAEKTVPTTKNDTEVAATRNRDQYLVPPVDIYESETGLTVIADLPGVDKDAISINVENGILTIDGKVRIEAQGDPIQSDYTLHDYFRQFQISDKVDVENINAQYMHGVLTVQLPRVPTAQPRQIPVQMA